MKLFVPWGGSLNIVWMQYSVPGCWVTQTYMDKVPSFSERRLTYEIFSNVRAGRCDVCAFQRLCVYVCVCVEGWLYTWLKGNIVAVESLLFLRDSFLYTKQSRDKQVLNRQEATKKPTKHAGIQEHTSRVEGHHRHYGKLESICSMTWKSNWLLEQLSCQQTLICCFDFISWFLT